MQRNSIRGARPVGRFWPVAFFCGVAFPRVGGLPRDPARIEAAHFRATKPRMGLASQCFVHMVRGMITELGHVALILALGVAIVQMIVPLIGAWKGWTGWMAVAVPAATLQFAFVASAFAALTWAFVNDDFSLQVVWANSHTLQPMLYKVSGVWGNHEGSMLLWVQIVTLFGATAAWFGGGLPPRLKARVLAVQASIAVHTEIARGGHPLFDLIDGLTDTIAEQRVRIIELKGEAERVRVEGA